MTYSFTVDYDETDLYNPRDDDNLGVIVAWHRRHHLGDDMPNQAPDEWLADLKKKEPKAIILPVYLYDHGGITIKTTPFNCPWDSGQAGYIYTTRERVRDWTGHTRMTAKRKAAIEDMLRDEIRIYDQYIRGDIYKYIIEDEDGNFIDGQGGYYDRQDCKNDASILTKSYNQERKAA